MSGGDERGDNKEELRKLDVGRGDGEVRQPSTAHTQTKYVRKRSHEL